MKKKIISLCIAAFMATSGLMMMCSCSGEFANELTNTPAVVTTTSSKWMRVSYIRFMTPIEGYRPSVMTTDSNSGYNYAEINIEIKDDSSFVLIEYRQKTDYSFEKMYVPTSEIICFVPVN